MIIQQFFVKGIAHSSYLLGGDSACAIVDPDRNIEMYLEAARAMDLKITHILETHLHADFIAGHMDLAAKTGAKIYVPKSGNCAFDHVPLVEGDSFEIEDMRVSVLETPGHTPEHIAFVVSDSARGKDPAAVFCGDTLFVGDVGRPDLFPDIAKELAGKLYHSLHDKLLKLPDFCEVYPAHGAGTLCGRALSAKRSSTVGYEKKFNPALRIRDKEEFIRSLTTDMPPAPDHFSRCSEVNRKGPAKLASLVPLKPMEPPAFQNALQGANAKILDIRSYDAFGGNHIPGALHVDFGGNFATFCGWLIEPDAHLYLVTDSPAQAQKAVVWLRRVGLDHSPGYLEGGMLGWAKAGLPMAHVRQMGADEVNAAAREGSMAFLDVRASSEFAARHIQNAVNIPAPELRTRYRELDPELPVLVICGTGQRSSMGASLLMQRGFREVFNAAGGMAGYAAAGFSPECPVCVAPHGPRLIGTHIE